MNFRRFCLALMDFFEAVFGEAVSFRADRININANVKAPTIRMHVKRSVTAGRYKISGSQKTGKRGKPSIVYTYDATPTVATTTTAESTQTSAN